MQEILFSILKSILALESAAKLATRAATDE